MLSALLLAFLPVQASPEPAHPRPTLVRETWTSLAGEWDVGVAGPSGREPPTEWSGSRSVPFRASVGELGGPRLWIRRTVAIPAEWRVQLWRLHVERALGAADVYVDGSAVAKDQAGFGGFDVDVTDAVRGKESVELVLLLRDDGRSLASAPDDVVIGLDGDIWLEGLPRTYVESIRTRAIRSRSQLLITVASGGATRSNLAFEVKLTVDGELVASARAPLDKRLFIGLAQPRWWTPDDPFLYDLELNLRDGNGRFVERVWSYVGLREVSLAASDGAEGAAGDPAVRIVSNAEPLVGPRGEPRPWLGVRESARLDGTALPRADALRSMGFDFVEVVPGERHAPSERWLAHCDRIGLSVCPLLTDVEPGPRFERLLSRAVGHPSVVGWAVHDPADVDRVRALDATRPIHVVERDPGRGSVVPGDPRAGTVRALRLQRPALALSVADFEHNVARTLPVGPSELAAVVLARAHDLLEPDGTPRFAPDRVLRALAGHLPPVVSVHAETFLDATRVALAAHRPDATIRWTADGSQPGPDAPVFEAPIELRATTTLAARSFFADGTASGVTRRVLRRVDPLPATAVPGAVQGASVGIFPGDGDELDLGEHEPETLVVVPSLASPVPAQDGGGHVYLVDATLTVPVRGVWRFALDSTRCRLWIADELVIDAGGRAGDIALEEGPHRFRLVAKPTDGELPNVAIECETLGLQPLPSAWLTTGQ